MLIPVITLEFQAVWGDEEMLSLSSETLYYMTLFTRLDYEVS
jgi:hypothetical protein